MTIFRPIFPKIFNSITLYIILLFKKSRQSWKNNNVIFISITYSADNLFLKINFSKEELIDMILALGNSDNNSFLANSSGFPKGTIQHQ